MKKIYKFLPIFLSALCGCSLKYGTPSYDEQNVPEFSFDDVKFNRFEDGNISMSLEAAGIEQYKDGKTTCAKDIDFKLIDEEGKISTEGSCSLVYADSEAEKYILYDKMERKVGTAYERQERHGNDKKRKYRDFGERIFGKRSKQELCVYRCRYR